MNWRCLAPLFLHFSFDAGMGILIKLPFKRGLFETTLILRFSAVYKRDPSG